jgi:hypothetical protein
VLRPDVKVLEVDAVDSAPGREVEKPKRTADDFVTHGGHVSEQCRVGTEQGGVQLILIEGAQLGGALVFGQVVHQPDHGRYIWANDAAHLAVHEEETSAF